MKNPTWLITLVAAGTGGLMACQTTAPGESAHLADQSIVRGSLDAQHPSVVGVISLYFENGARRSACTGTYVAPRLVLTAAHCIPSNRVWTRVYHGSDLKTAYEAMDLFAALPEGTAWAQAETVRVHPKFNTTDYLADMAIVALDRELPIPVTPVAKKRLDDRRIGELGTMVGFGASASDEMLTVTQGWGVKRVGQSPFLGSPVAGMQTDHPGIGSREVRESLAMFDGGAPNSNGCAGDSGGPILMNVGNKEHVFGVAAWTGFYCEDYSFYTRLDPFLPFIEESVTRAGHGAIEPFVECVRPIEGGRTRAYLGYQSANDVSLDIPFGPANRMPLDLAGNRPSHFEPGEHRFAVAADLDNDANLFWKLQSPSGRTGVVNGRLSKQPPCAADDFGPIATDACMAMAAAHCGQSISYCVDSLQWEWDGVGSTECGSAYLEYQRCTANLPAEAFACSGEYAFDTSTVCEARLLQYFTCIGIL